MEVLIALVVLAGVIGLIAWRLGRKKPSGGSSSQGGGGRPGADQH